MLGGSSPAVVIGGRPFEDSSPGTGGNSGMRRAGAGPPVGVGTDGCGAGVAAMGET